MQKTNETLIEARFADEVFDCIEELNKMLPQFSARYQTPVLLTGLAQVLSGVLNASVQGKLCTPEEAFEAISILTRTAFTSPSASDSFETSQQSAITKHRRC
jgi:hypothetical protein